MQFSRFAFLLLILASQILSSCSSRSENSNVANTAANSSNTNQTGPKDNIEELGMLVHLPFEPEEVAWEEKPEQKKLIAVIRFSPENAAKMAAEAARNGPPSSETLTVENWYPNELIAQGELTGESTVKGQSYNAASFLNPPYTKGKITRVENTDYFILQISS
ncbi:MAG: hypothetical protein DMF63_04765 [Acidobacteria bacterium]|nr:MAG: hypothetical protein DMF63_04765 [Acidobacteriota bacterium]